MIRFLKLLLIISFLSAMPSCGKKDTKSVDQVCHNVFVFTPDQSNAGASVKTFPGVVEEAGNVAVSFKTAGQIAGLFAKEGDHVSKGQLLAVLDSVDYALGVNQLRVQYAQQKSEYDRKKQLHATGNISDNEMEKVAAGLNQLYLQLQLNENKLKYCSLYAPTSGVITKRNFERAEMVDAGTPVFDLMDNNHLEVVVDLPVANYIDRPNFRTFTGHTTHSQDADIALSLISITPKADNNQLYRMKLLVSDGGAQLTPGMNISVDISSDGNGSTGAYVPLSAVFEKDGVAAVWTVNPADSIVKFTPVTLSGDGQNGMILVTEGLVPDRQIVRAGAHHLKDGEKVRVISEKSSTNPGNLL